MTTTAAPKSAAAKLEALEARATLAPSYPGPAAECVQTAQGIISNQAVTVRIIDGTIYRYETRTSSPRLTRAEVLAAIA